MVHSQLSKLYTNNELFNCTQKWINVILSSLQFTRELYIPGRYLSLRVILYFPKFT